MALDLRQENLTMARAAQKLVLNPSENIPYDKLVLSQKNVRRVKNGISIEDPPRISVAVGSS